MIIYISKVKNELDPSTKIGVFLLFSETSNITQYEPHRTAHMWPVAHNLRVTAEQE